MEEECEQSKQDGGRINAPVHFPETVAPGELAQQYLSLRIETGDVQRSGDCFDTGELVGYGRRASAEEGETTERKRNARFP
jgi:hypothetical protein